MGNHFCERGWLVCNGRLGGVDGSSVERWTGASRLYDRWSLGCVHNFQHFLPGCRRAGRERCRVPRRTLRLAVGGVVDFGVIFRIVAVPPTPHVSVQKISVTADEEGLRLDRWFRAKFPEVTQGRLEKLLRKGEVRVNGGRVRASLRLETGMLVRIPPLRAPESATRPGPVAQSDVMLLQERIIYRDDVLIAIDKPAGLAVQGGSGTPRHLDGMLDTLQFDAPDRPRLVHRLDRDTSGVLILARTRAAATVLTAAFADRDAQKKYWALVHGSPESDEGRLDSSLSKVSSGGGREQMASVPGGKPAITLYQVMARSGAPFTWLELTPLTGRTHQIRVQTAEADFPVVGDPRYGRRETSSSNPTLGRGLHLHARELTILHPEGGTLRVAARLPAHMVQSWRAIGWDEPPPTTPQRKV